MTQLVEIIDIPGLGRRAAEKVCEDLGIKSQNDTAKLDEAKEITYKKGFYEGTMLVGSQKGKRVEDAKPVVQQEMIDAGQAFMYYEPNGQVISRSGDECVVTFSDQWYLTYGEKGWKEPVMDYIKNNLETFNPKTKQALEASCDWLSSWACSRQFGLGTRVGEGGRCDVAALGPAVPDRVAVGLHNLHGVLHDRPPAAGQHVRREDGSTGDSCGEDDARGLRLHLLQGSGYGRERLRAGGARGLWHPSGEAGEAAPRVRVLVPVRPAREQART